MKNEEYAMMWPRGEQWCQELDVFHNPRAAHSLGLELLPGGTHWFERHGEIVCLTMWKNSVLSSVTNLNVKRPKAKSRRISHAATRKDCQTCE